MTLMIAFGLAALVTESITIVDVQEPTMAGYDREGHRKLIYEDPDGVVHLGPFSPVKDDRISYVYRERTTITEMDRVEDGPAELESSGWGPQLPMRREVRTKNGKQQIYWTTAPIAMGGVEETDLVHRTTVFDYKILKKRSPVEEGVEPTYELFWHAVRIKTTPDQ